MAGNIKGITIEIGGDTTGLNKAISESRKTTNGLDKELRALNSALKLDTGNVDLLKEKQKVLSQAVQETQKRTEALQTAKDNADKAMANGTEINRQEYTKLVTELSKAKTSTAKYKDELNATTAELDQNTKAASQTKVRVDEYSRSVNRAATENLQLNGRLGEVANALGVKVPQGASKAIASMTASVAACGALMAATGTLIGKLIRASTETAKLADDIVTLSKVTGLSTDAIQELNYASELMDVSTEVMTDSMARMVRNMNMAREGTGQAADAFKKLGIAITNNDGTLRNQQQVFYELIDKLGRVRNETERDAMAMAIFGRSARELNPLILAGSNELKKLAQEAHNTGYVMSGETLNSFNSLQDSLDRLDNKTLALKAAMGEALLPILTAIVDIVSAIPPDVAAIIVVVATITVSIVTLVQTIKTVTAGVKMLSSIFGFGVNPTLLKTIAIVMLVVAALVALGVIIATIQGRAKEMEHTFASVNRSVGSMSYSASRVPSYAVGTSYHPGGMALVGEQGPELVALPRGSKVYTARQTEAVMNNSSTSNHTVVNVTVNGIREYNELMAMIKDSPAAIRARG
ncbi:phage tail tape measure protein [Gehongia tenuis]|uniref:Uncharacterized protein n=1 Tax=Gehongia tenuis TaxID=2763655 RepID=A0A926HL90_9FIRM|nr:hypothetical protein [Gehongia tenuis]MBC8531812.1 hypothetical protein [Gehongia tenuis]